MTRYVENLFWNFAHCSYLDSRQELASLAVLSAIAEVVHTEHFFFLKHLPSSLDVWKIHFTYAAVRCTLYYTVYEMRLGSTVHLFLALASNVTVTAARFSPVMHQRRRERGGVSFSFLVIVTSPENVFIARWTTNLSVVLEWKNLFFLPINFHVDIPRRCCWPSNWE